MSELDVLDAIEALELRALRWGFTEGSLSDSEVEALARDAVGDAAADDAIDRLLRRQLLFEVLGGDGEVRLRSRFAEMVRLLSRLRQLFPNRPWAGAPRLVSDYRVDLRRRRYAARNLPSRDVLERIAGAHVAPLRRQFWEALTEGIPHLADFQESASRTLLAARGDTGLIVTAGTGSGKTLAFYLPALIRIAEEIRAGQFWTKALAVYPRTELLKDQFAETFRMARRLDDGLAAPRRRLIIGPYFSSTPNRADAQSVADRGWLRRNRAFVCPWLPCPACGAELLWREADLSEGRERLVCAAVDCQGEITDQEMVLTRNRLVREPPDILFTTTEMLNQRLSDLGARRVFGVGQPPGRRPLYALLDEVHTYTGVSGAQAALTLRRWRHALGAPVTYVGLSATLQEAPQFFADLTGLDPALVQEASPVAFEDEGAEYQVILRGDPASQTSLLSTSIQTLMLMGRMMDPLANGASAGAFGSRVFAFTDNLDVINRLFDSLRDAEGLDIFGRPEDPPLAALRQRPLDAVERLRRERDGQVWRAVETLGRSLTAPLRVGRTTSDDAGVMADADVVVATAALEVGYNDSRVGAVVQHKAPRDAASFLQRRGRAGRARGSRPVTVTVLSDYGRDRVAFEAYEHLFDPELPPQRLPVDNEYVLRMQATYALFDWLAAESGARYGWAWDVLSRPGRDGSPPDPLREDAKRRLLKLIEGDPVAVRRLSDHLRAALRIDAATVESLLWRPPRALLLEAAPTLARRLHRDWRRAHTPPSARDLQTDYHPLPDFVARNLFGDLNLPEVTVVLPSATRNDQPKMRSMPIAAALTELAPGRVTRRFAVEHGALHHWSPLDPDLAHQTLAIAQVAEVSEAVGTFVSEGTAYAVFRPWIVVLDHAAKAVAGPSSNAWLDWKSDFVPAGEATAIDLGTRNPWRRHFRSVASYLHRFRSHVATRRFAVGGQAVLRRSSGAQRIDYRFQDADDQPAALGFEIEVDALAAELDLTEAEAAMAGLTPDLLANCRLGYLRHRLMTDTELDPEIDAFQRDWLNQIFMAAALVRAVTDDIDLSAAALAVLDDPAAAHLLTSAMSAVFQGQAVSDDPDDHSDTVPPTVADGATTAQGLALGDLFRREDVRQRLRALAAEMAAPDAGSFANWLRQTLISTTGEAFLQACVALVPRHVSADSLVVDVVETGATTVWVTESTLGGAGVLQAVFERAADEPRTLFTALEAALAPTDLELAAEGLEAFVRLAQGDDGVAAAVAEVRAAGSYAARDTARQRLYALLSDRGLDVGHALSVSLNARMLSSGGNVAMDALLVRLLDRWRAIETQHGVAVGVRQIAFVLALDATLRTAVREATSAPHDLNPAETAQILANLLWPRGVEISQRALQSYNRYAPRRTTDPRLARALFAPGMPQIRMEDAHWRQDMATALARDGSVELSAPAHDPAGLRAGLLEALAEPVDVGFLQFFPRIERAERSADRMIVTLVVQEQV